MSDKQDRNRQGTPAEGGAGAAGLGAGAASLGAGATGLGAGAAGSSGNDAARMGQEAMRGAAEMSAQLSRDMIDRAGQGFDVMRQIGETLGSGARTTAGEVSEYLRHTAQRQQEMAQQLAQARTPGDVLDIQTRYYQDNLRELFGLTERLSRNTAETAHQAGQRIGGRDEGPGRA
jgi:hypothetical protein